MQHITMADKSLLTGDSVTELLLEYAALLGQIRSADTVKVHALSSDGNDTVACFLLNSGTVILAEETHTSAPEPDNSEAERYLQGRLDSYRLTSGDPLGFNAPAADSPY